MMKGDVKASLRGAVGNHEAGWALEEPEITQTSLSWEREIS
jgi:hypothetical protein